MMLMLMLPLLLLSGAARLAGACSCFPAHPQQAFCNADVVIRVRVMGQRPVVTGRDNYGNPINMLQFDVKQLKMFKGPEREIDTILTASSSSLCGIHLDNSEFLITGNLDANGTLNVKLCDYMEPWAALSQTQRRSLGPRYQMGCECKIVQCPMIPCSISEPAECLWTDWVLEETVLGTQAKLYTCVKRSDSSCAWYRGADTPKKDFLDVEEP